MKSSILLFTIILISIVNLFAQAPTLRNPECIIFDDVTDVYYISNVGLFNEPDGKISILTRGYTLKDFITWGMVDPKGIVILDRKMYVADVTKIVIIDLEEIDIINTINVAGSEFLNGICSDGERYIYITEMFQNKIFRLDTKTNQVNALQLKGSVLTPNGIYFDKPKNRLVVVSFKEEAPIYEVLLNDLTVKVIMYSPVNFADGIVMDRANNFYISSWENQTLGTGKIVRYDYDFELPEFVIATGLSGPAAMYFNRTLDSLLVPNMISNSITYYYQPSKPENVEKVSPVDGAEDLNLSVEFSWKRADGARRYTIHVATDEEFSENLSERTILNPNILSTKFDLETNTKYYWRIRSQNSLDNSDWGDAWSFMTVDINKYKVKLIQPENTASSVSRKPVFLWNSIPVQSYEISISDNYQFSGTPLLNIKDIADTTYTTDIELNKKTGYYWRVRGHTTEPQQWSEIWYFMTIGDVPYKPQLLFPENDAKDIEIKYTFEWEFQDDADDYKLLLSESPDMSNPKVYDVSFDNFITIDELKLKTTYYWQIISINEYGESEPSDIWSFTTVEVTSVIEYDEMKRIHLYPNPAGNFIEVISDYHFLDGYDVSIMNSLGIEIYNHFHIGSKFSVNISDFPSGIYYLKTESAGRIFVNKFCVLK